MPFSLYSEIISITVWIPVESTLMMGPISRMTNRTRAPDPLEYSTSRIRSFTNAMFAK